MKNFSALGIASIVLGVIVLAFLFRYSATRAFYCAKDNASYTEQFNAASAAVADYRKRHHANPSNDYLTNTELNVTGIYYTRPADRFFDFPTWKKAESYAIASWNGDYPECLERLDAKTYSRWKLPHETVPTFA